MIYHNNCLLLLKKNNGIFSLNLYKEKNVKTPISFINRNVHFMMKVFIHSVYLGVFTGCGGGFLVGLNKGFPLC